MSKYVFGKTRNAKILETASRQELLNLSKQLARAGKVSGVITTGLGRRNVIFKTKETEQASACSSGQSQ